MSDFHRERPIRRWALILLLTLVGCGGASGPPTTHSNSSRLTTVGEKAEVLHHYVQFRRTYETLDYDIRYQNNNGRMPGPSEWDIRVVATVPASEIPTWIPSNTAPSTQDRDWLKTVPTTLDLSGIDEWYADGGRVCGIDRKRRIVAYRNLAI